MLQFWWYASLARHLGIGGLSDRESTKYQALKSAMNLYIKHKQFFTRGTFYGITQNIHLHVDKLTKLGIITAYNLTSRAQKVEIKVNLLKFGLDISSIDIYNGVNQKLMSADLTPDSEGDIRFNVEIPPLSPIIALFKR
jgi:hypothetical protein